MTGSVLAIDQGTSGTKALVICPDRGVIGSGTAPVRPRHLPGGRVEVDPVELYESVVDAGRRALAQAGEPVAAVGLANQGETVFAWDPSTGDAAAADLGAPLTALRVDSGLTRSALLKQTQADLRQLPVEVSALPDATALDTGTRGPAVDGAFRTSREGVFAVGNVLHAVESAAAVAREGVRAARHVRDHLAGAPWSPTVPLLVVPPLRWAAPNRLAAAMPYGPFVLGAAEFLTRPVLTVTQDDRVLHRQRLLATAVPNRPLRLDGRWVGSVDPAAGPVRVTAR